MYRVPFFYDMFVESSRWTDNGLDMFRTSFKVLGRSISWQPNEVKHNRILFYDYYKSKSWSLSIRGYLK